MPRMGLPWWLTRVHSRWMQQRRKTWFIKFFFGCCAATPWFRMHRWRISTARCAMRGSMRAAMVRVTSRSKRKRPISSIEAALALQTALAALPEEQREVVVMRIWSGMTLEEISTATDAPLNTVASRYRYALEKLRERLKPASE